MLIIFHVPTIPVNGWPAIKDLNSVKHAEINVKACSFTLYLHQLNIVQNCYQQQHSHVAFIANYSIVLTILSSISTVLHKSSVICV